MPWGARAGEPRSRRVERMSQGRRTCGGWGEGGDIGGGQGRRPWGGQCEGQGQGQEATRAWPWASSGLCHELWGENMPGPGSRGPRGAPVAPTEEERPAHVSASHSVDKACFHMDIELESWTLAASPSRLHSPSPEARSAREAGRVPRVTSQAPCLRFPARVWVSPLWCHRGHCDPHLGSPLLSSRRTLRGTLTVGSSAETLARVPNARPRGGDARCPLLFRRLPFILYVYGTGQGASARPQDAPGPGVSARRAQHPPRCLLTLTSADAEL